MDTTAENPYKAPESAVESPTSGQLSEVFDRFTAWGVFGLSIITLGIYPLVWFYKRSERVNSRTNSSISSAFINSTLALWAISFIASFGEFVVPEIAIVSGILSLVVWILMIVWAFKMRDAIHVYVGANKKTYAWANAFLTFWLGPLYLQYKINKIIDNQ